MVSKVEKLNSADARGQILKIARQMAGNDKDVAAERYMKNDHGNIILDQGGKWEACRSYHE